MQEEEIKLFHKYLCQSKRYFEYGSGGSTCYAIKLGVPEIISVETDKDWYQKVSQNKLVESNIKNNQLQLIFMELPIIWYEYVSWAGEKQKIMTKEGHQAGINYSNLIYQYHHNPDLILIDGRYRVACALKCYCVMNQESIILIHDYTNRSQYHIIEKFFQPIEKVSTLQAFKKKNLTIDEFENLKQLIQKYEKVID